MLFIVSRSENVQAILNSEKSKQTVVQPNIGILQSYEEMS